MCPTYSHTMHSISTAGEPIWWCPRCGTIKLGVHAPPVGIIDVPRWTRLLREARVSISAEMPEAN